MPSNLESPGRPSSSSHSGLQATTTVPYVAWTLDVHPWMDQALCDPWSADEWFDGPTAYAVAVCKQCPVKDLCLERTLKMEENETPWGVAGGLTAEERRQQRTKQRKARAKEPARCGTTAGYYRHVRNKTAKCQPCWDAKAALMRDRRSA